MIYGCGSHNTDKQADDRMELCLCDGYAARLSKIVPPPTGLAGKLADGEGKQGFYVYEVAGEKMVCGFVPLDHISARTDGYGPGGHPNPEMRDYSLAWEKENA